jgi:hypothetical protein
VRYCCHVRGSSATAPALNKLSDIGRPGAPADSPDDGGGYLGPTRQRALQRSLSCQRRGCDIRLLHQPIECRSAGLGHWFVRHSQSGERSAGFGGILFGLECHKQRLGVFQHCTPQKLCFSHLCRCTSAASGRRLAPCQAPSLNQRPLAFDEVAATRARWEALYTLRCRRDARWHAWHVRWPSCCAPSIASPPRLAKVPWTKCVLGGD